MPDDDPRKTEIELRRTFVCEALDVAHVHMTWASQHLQNGQDERAIAAFEKFIDASKEAAVEMRAIRAALEAGALTRIAAEEFRKARGQGRQRPAHRLHGVSVGQPA